MMNQEFETKVLDINPNEIDKKLLSLGAQKIDEKLMRRWVFDWVEKDPDFINEWIRVRDDGTKTTIAYKKRNAKVMAITKEIEIVVDNFDKTAEIFLQIPFKRKFYQENKRITYILGDIQFMIDTWPKLKPNLEIESTSIKGVEKGLKLLNLKGKEIGDVSINNIYKKVGIDLHSISELKFD